jgi:catechol 2,3-dioxygenase-like lactoylglutathione lyase family enzyme
VPVVHHTAIRVHDVEASLRFWSDGLGFEVLMDKTFEGDWPTLLDAPSKFLRSIFLGRPDRPDCGIVELVDLGANESRERAPRSRSTGFLLVSIMTDVDSTLGRLAALGLGGDPRRINVSGVAMCTVVDPDGVVVELIESIASANLERLSSP